MSKIYTKTGDKGETGLVSGKRISKADPRIDLYGEVDELNSRLGYSISLMGEKHPAISTFLKRIQCALFDLGSNLACEEELRGKYKLPQVQSQLVLEIEKNIDEMEKNLSPLKNFILPGGSVLAASLHLCRTSARNCERKLVHFHESTKENLPENSLHFLNRLSDYLFVLSRNINQYEKIEEIPWKAHH